MGPRGHCAPGSALLRCEKAGGRPFWKCWKTGKLGEVSCVSAIKTAFYSKDRLRLRLGDDPLFKVYFSF